MTALPLSQGLDLALQFFLEIIPFFYKTTLSITIKCTQKKELKNFYKNENDYPKTLQMDVNHLGTEDKPSLKNNSVMTEK